MVLREGRVRAVLQSCGSLITQLGAITAQVACLGAHTVFVVVLLWKELAAEERTLSPKLKLCSATLQGHQSCSSQTSVVCWLMAVLCSHFNTCCSAEQQFW